MNFVSHLLLALPFCAFAYVTIRLYRKGEAAGVAITGIIAALCLFAHPAIQFLGDELLGYPYAKKKEALALEADIVGKQYVDLVKSLGEPDAARVVHPGVVLETKTRIARVDDKQRETYQRISYHFSPLLYTSTEFIVFLDMKGRVKSHRVKWEHGEGR